MGSGRWSTDIYDEHNHVKAAAGKSVFDYSDVMHKSGRSSWRVHKNSRSKQRQGPGESRQR